MDTALVASLAGALLVGVAAVLWIRRLRRLKQMGELALLPARVVNPRLFADLKTIRAWELLVERRKQACNWAREAHSKRFRTEVAVPLPIAGCGRHCTCRYLPITENRRRQRRGDPIDQAVLGLGKPGDANRRQPRGRRKEDHWSGDQR